MTTTSATDHKVAAIKRIVAAGFEVTVDALDSYARPKNLALARQVAMAFCRDYLSELVPFTKRHAPLSYPAIAAQFKRDAHMTVAHACKHVAQLYAVDHYFAARVDRLRKEVEANLRKAA